MGAGLQPKSGHAEILERRLLQEAVRVAEYFDWPGCLL